MRAGKDYGVVRSIDELQALVDRLLEDQLLVAFDVETSYSTAKPVPKRALDVTHNDQYVCGFSLSNDPSWARYVPLRHDDYEGNLPVIEAWETVRPLLEQADLLAHQKKFEDKNLRMLAVKGDARAPIVTRVGHDTLLSAYVLGRFREVGLKPLSKQVLKYDQKEFGSLFGDEVKDKNGKIVPSKVEKRRFSELSPDDPHVLSYVCDDVTCALELHAILQRGLELDGPKRQFIYNLEMQVSDMMADVELYGVAVDWEPMERHRALYKPFADLMEQSVKDGFAALIKDPEARANIQNLNFRSSPQMQKLFYTDIGWQATRFSKAGNPSTDKIALEALSRKQPAVKRLLQMRQMHNLGARHVTWLDEYRQSYDHRVHPNFSQTKVASGRFAADKPAIQQLPKRWYWDVRKPGETEEEVRANSHNGERYWEGYFRRYVIAAPGNYLITYDYSQVELRVLAGVSKEARLLQAFNDDEDVHTVTAAQMLGLDVADVDDEARSKGKTLNFALLYGMGIKSLADRLALSIPAASELYASYFRQFTSVSSFVDNQRRKVGGGMSGPRHGKWVETYFGRRIPVWEVESDIEGVRKKGERVAVNAPIQGGAADYMKIAMVRVCKALRANGWWNNGVMVTMNQHDSLTFEVSNDLDPNEVRDVLMEAVVFPVEGFPKIKADWELGQSWGASTKWGDAEQAEWDGERWTVAGKEASNARADDGLEDMADWEAMEDQFDVEDEEAIEAAMGDESAMERVLSVRCKDLVTKDALLAFVSLVRSTPGDSAVELCFGNDSPITLSLTTSLTTDDAGRVSLALGGAIVDEYDRPTDIESEVAGLSL